MLLESEYRRFSILAFVAPDAFKYPQTIMKGVRQDVDVGIIPVYKFSMHPDFFTLFHDILLFIVG